MEKELIKACAIAAAVIPLGGVGFAVSKVFTTMIETIGKNPEARDKVFTVGVLGGALTEAVALFILLSVFLIYIL